MTKTTTAHVVTAALAVLMALSMLAGTNALASHQYRVAANAHAQAQERVVASTAHLVVLGQRVAQL